MGRTCDVDAGWMILAVHQRSDRPAYHRCPVTSRLSAAAVATQEPVVVQDVTTDPDPDSVRSTTRWSDLPCGSGRTYQLARLMSEDDRVNAFGQR